MAKKPKRPSSRKSATVTFETVRAYALALPGADLAYSVGGGGAFLIYWFAGRSAAQRT